MVDIFSKRIYKIIPVHHCMYFPYPACLISLIHTIKCIEDTVYCSVSLHPVLIRWKDNILTLGFLPRKEAGPRGVAAPVLAAASWTAVLYILATASLYQHEPIFLIYIMIPCINCCMLQAIMLLQSRY
jgi:hypothetical protein